MASNTLNSVLNTKPLLLDPINNRFPEDIVIKINNIICDDYIKDIYKALEINFIKNAIKIFLNDKKLSKFLYYLGYQTYYFNNMLTHNYGIYGETLNNLEWGDYESEISLEDYQGINDDTREPYVLNMPNDVIITQDNMNININSHEPEMEYYNFDVNIYSTSLTLNETLWILQNFSVYDTTILNDISEYSDDTGVDSNISIANFEIDSDPTATFESIYDYDKDEFAIIWNLFNRGYCKFNIFKIIYIYCYNTELDNTIQKYYNLIGGTGRVNITIDNAKLFLKTSYNITKYFNKKIKKAAEDSIVISYLYAIYADDGITAQFIDEHEKYENRAYDILNDNGLLKTKEENILNILDLLYILYLK
jgi:hypothetical protein